MFWYFLIAYENEDQLLWQPDIISENKVKEYLFETSVRTGNEKIIGRIPDGVHTRDNEQVCFNFISVQFASLTHFLYLGLQNK